MLGDLKLYETSDDEDLIKNLPKITQEVAGPQAQPYIESFTEDVTSPEQGSQPNVLRRMRWTRSRTTQVRRV